MIKKGIFILAFFLSIFPKTLALESPAFTITEESIQNGNQNTSSPDFQMESGFAPISRVATAPNFSIVPLLAPSTCGNGIVETGETCDGNDFGGQSCSAYGFSGGELSCVQCQTISTNACISPEPEPGGNDGGSTPPPPSGEPPSPQPVPLPEKPPVPSVPPPVPVIPLPPTKEEPEAAPIPQLQPETPLPLLPAPTPTPTQKPGPFFTPQTPTLYPAASDSSAQSETSCVPWFWQIIWAESLLLLLLILWIVFELQRKNKKEKRRRKK